MKRKLIMAAVAVLFTAVQAIAGNTNWQPTDKYKISFSGDDADGIFKTFSATLAFDEQNPAASKFTATVDINSINTGNGLKNKHAKGGDWFEADKYPQIKFVSEKIEKSGGSYKATGVLEMHGVKKQIVIPFTFKQQGNSGVFAGSFTVNRIDFHIGKAGNKVGEVIKVDLNVPVVKK